MKKSSKQQQQKSFSVERNNNNTTTNGGNQHEQQQQQQPSRIIRAVYTDTTVRVYQAYNDEIANSAIESQSFESAMSKGLWSPKRMTWIKPSKIWMAYRCGWTLLKDKNQSRVLALDLDRIKFDQLLEQGMLTHEGGDDEKTTNNDNKKCRDQSVVIQWDPERVIDPNAHRTQVFTRSIQSIRSIQIGLRPPANECLLDPAFLIKITDVTQDFQRTIKAIQQLDDGGTCKTFDDINEIESLLWPDGNTEKVLTVPPHVQSHLGMTTSTSAVVARQPTQAASNSNIEKKEQPQAVVVLGCTANPPHQGHIHCIKEAQNYAEKILGYDVLFSTIAVAPLGYVKNKSKKSNCPLVFDDETRLHILKNLMTTADQSSDNNEFSFKIPTKTYGSALECGRSLRPSSDVTVIVVVGSDRFKYTKPSHPDVVTLCCPRGDGEKQIFQLKENFDLAIQEGLVSDPTKWHLLSTTTVGPSSTSSTMIRSILVDKETSVAKKVKRLKENGYSNEAVDVLMKFSSSLGQSEPEKKKRGNKKIVL